MSNRNTERRLKSRNLRRFYRTQLHPPLLQSGVGLSANALVARHERASITNNTIFFIVFESPFLQTICELAENYLRRTEVRIGCSTQEFSKNRTWSSGTKVPGSYCAVLPLYFYGDKGLTLINTLSEISAKVLENPRYFGS